MALLMEFDDVVGHSLIIFITLPGRPRITPTTSNSQLLEYCVNTVQCSLFGFTQRSVGFYQTSYVSLSTLLFGPHQTPSYTLQE